MHIVVVSYSQPIRFARLDSEHGQSDENSVNRGLMVRDLPRGRDSWYWPKGARPLHWEREWQRFFCFAHPFRKIWRRNLYCRILRSVNHYHHHPVLAILAKTSQVRWERSKLVKKLGMIGPVAQDYGQMPLISEANTNDRNMTQCSFMMLTWSSDWIYLTEPDKPGTNPLLFVTFIWQSYKLKSSFLPACGFALVNLWVHEKNWNFRISLCSPCDLKSQPHKKLEFPLPVQFTAQIPNITAKKAKSRIPPNLLGTLN